jgi:hypothetical protein
LSKPFGSNQQYLQFIVAVRTKILFPDPDENALKSFAGPSAKYHRLAGGDGFSIFRTRRKELTLLLNKPYDSFNVYTFFSPEGGVIPWTLKASIS